MKRLIDHIDATPSKRVYSSIIADYNLNTGICELIDNAIDVWTRNKECRPLKIEVRIELDQQTLQVCDNAGGRDKSELELMVTPGSSSWTDSEESIGIFGVGSKRAVVALAQEVRIKTRYKSNKTHLLELDDEWLKDESWNLNVYEVSAIDVGSTIVQLTKLRFKIENQDVEFLKEHLQCTYAIFLAKSNFQLFLQGDPLTAMTFEKWAYPPDYSPRLFKGTLKTDDGDELRFEAVAGLMNEQGSIAGEYGVYFYCNNRLIARALKTYDVGFVAGQAGAPHNVVSLVRVIVFLNGPARCMPWNSSKSSLNPNHRTFKTIQRWVIQTTTRYANVCKRLHGEWDEKVFKYPTGEPIEVSISDFDAIKKSFLPPLPSKQIKYGEALLRVNQAVLKRKPWTQGLYEADLAVDLIQRQKLEQKNRLALVLLDSTLEIGFKDFLVNESGRFYTDAELVALFGSRHKVEAEIQKHVKLSVALWKKLKFYYGLRCKLVHERSTAGITDPQIEDFRKAVQQVLSKLFRLKWIKVHR